MEWLGDSDDGCGRSEGDESLARMVLTASLAPRYTTTTAVTRSVVLRRAWPRCTVGAQSAWPCLWRCLVSTVVHLGEQRCSQGEEISFISAGD